jgi:hypothetical protein
MGRRESNKLYSYIIAKQKKNSTKTENLHARTLLLLLYYKNDLLTIKVIYKFIILNLNCASRNLCKTFLLLHIIL